MTAEEVAARYNKIPGFRLVDYHSVALPLWLVTFDALVIAEKKYAVVDEFILRAIDREVNTVQDLAGFLGLSEKLVIRRLGTLAASDMIVSLPSGGDGPAQLKLTTRGSEVVRETAKTPPRREKLVIAYDAIARQPITGRIARESFRTPQQIKQYGLFELPALPGRAPDDTELGRINYNTALPKETKKDQKIHQVLSAQKVGTLARRYREGIMLIYSGVADSEQVAVRFFSIDGRPMPEVNEGFQSNHGLQKLSIHEQLKKHRDSLECELLQDADYKAVVEFAKTAAPSADVSATIAESAKLSAAIEEKQQKAAAEGVPTDELQKLKQEIETLRKEKSAAQKAIETSPGRFLEPQEHAPLFERSLREARKRLLVISPWINDAVMWNKLRSLEELLRRGVEVYIGYGITERGPDDRKSRRGDQTLDWLQQKGAAYKNLHVVRLGDTHAKVLLMDDKFVVVGSFNWMSFGGFDRNENGVRVVREELSTMVTVPSMIEQMFVRFRGRFDRYTGGTPTRVPSDLEKMAFPEEAKPKAPAALPPPSKPVPAPAVAKAPPPPLAKQPVMPLKLTPRMVAMHLGKKPFVVIATAMEKGHFVKLNDILPADALRAVYGTFNHALPTAQEVETLRKATDERSPQNPKS